jgi:hypothetical protein
MPKAMRLTERSFFVDSIEMAGIKFDTTLLKKFKTGHRHAREMKGKFVR